MKSCQAICKWLLFVSPFSSLPAPAATIAGYTNRIIAAQYRPLSHSCDSPPICGTTSVAATASEHHVMAPRRMLTDFGREGHYDRTIQHLVEKYGPDGYLTIWMPQSDNAVRLEELRSIIANKESLRSIFDRLFDEETSE